MKSYKKQSKFSDLYWRYRFINSSLRRTTTHKHPFQFLEDELKESDEEDYRYGFTGKFETLLSLKTIQREIYTAFELEYMHLESNKTKYLNKIVAQLFVLLGKLEKNTPSSTYKEDYKFKVLKSITKDILKDIFITYHLSLNKVNRNKLSKWFYLKEPISSFQLITPIDDNKLERLYKKYLKNIFIALETEFYTFKLLFYGATLENKINWVEDKSSLYYFIKLLITKDVIKNPRNKHWEITAEFFLLKGENLNSGDLLNQKGTQNKEKQEYLNRFVGALKDPNS